MTAKKKPDAVETNPAEEPTVFEDATGVAGTDQPQSVVDEAEDKGYIGEKTDPRPNSDYSMEGGAPAPK